MNPRRLGLLSLLCAAAALPATAQNLIPNPAFSQGNASWNWHGLGGTETCCAGAQPTGAYPEAFAHPNGAGGYIASWSNVTNNAAGNYTLSGWIRSSGGTQQAWIQADNGVFEGRYCQTPTTNTANWAQFSCTFSLGSAATIHIAIVASNAAPTAWGWVAYDNLSLTRSGTPTSYDLAQYMGRTSSGSGPIYNFTSGEKMQVQWGTVANGMSGFYQVKNAQWEEIGYDANYIYRLRDTSPGGGNLYALWRGCPGACALGARWAPRTMALNGTYWRGDNQVKFYTKATCTKNQDYPQASGIKLVAQYPTLNINGYNLTDVIKLVSYFDANYTNPWEEYFYARGIGLVKWRDVGSNTIFQYNGTATGAPTRESVCTPSP